MTTNTLNSGTQPALSLVCIVTQEVNLQRNRLEGTDFKPPRSDGARRKRDSKIKPKLTRIYKYPISNPNVLEAHIFPAQRRIYLPLLEGGIL